MTREEAFKNRPTLGLTLEQSLSVDRYIESIYDDFESRICGNCEYGEYDSDIKEIYCPFVNYCGTDYMDKDFGCNKFEPKENK